MVNTVTVSLNIIKAVEERIGELLYAHNDACTTRYQTIFFKSSSFFSLSCFLWLFVTGSFNPKYLLWTTRVNHNAELQRDTGHGASVGAFAVGPSNCYWLARKEWKATSRATRGNCRLGDADACHCRETPINSRTTCLPSLQSQDSEAARTARRRHLHLCSVKGGEWRREAQKPRCQCTSL